MARHRPRDPNQAALVIGWISSTDVMLLCVVLLAAVAFVAEAQSFRARQQRDRLYVEIPRLKDERTKLLSEVGKAQKLQASIAELHGQLSQSKQTARNLSKKIEQERAQRKTIDRELVGLAGQLRRVAILFDASGSMNVGRSGSSTARNEEQSSRWDEARIITKSWLERLEFDECALIVFADRVSLFPSDGSVQRVTGPNGEAIRKKLQDYLSNIKPGGMTNTLAAMEAAYQYKGIDTIILFSDGSPNIDPKRKFDPDMVEQIYGLCKAHPGIQVNTIGLGDYFDHDCSTFLRTVANLTGGAFLGR